jgi:thiol:disulfide interchange protein
MSKVGSRAADGLDEAMAAAMASGKRVFLYFETDWCGPCKTMDQWIWTDAEVVAALQAGYVGVKLDGDIEKEHVRRYDVKGYPVRGYQSSHQLLDFVRGTQRQQPGRRLFPSR